MFRLWLTTCPDDFAGEYDDIEEMFKRGLGRLILQKRRNTPESYERWLLSLPMEFRDRIWVRGTPDLAEQLDVRGCVAEAQTLMGEVPESWKRVNCIAFCRNFDQLNQLPGWVSGALIGPIYQPQSALQQVQTIGFDSFLSALSNPNGSQKNQIPIIPFGGIDEENVNAFKSLPKELGISGISVIGGIWNYADSVNAFIKLNRLCV
ncbi:MAG: hypothetical protein MJY98_12115 [Fibrobacter sp.]|nr:hypothetical protein [Fibrobacter sp.]